MDKKFNIEDFRKKGIYARLCKDFARQAQYTDHSLNSCVDAVKINPWVSTYPWSKHGIPESLHDIKFNVLQELHEEYAEVLKGYDSENATHFKRAARDIHGLLNKQRKEDLDYMKENATEEQLTHLISEAAEIFQDSIENKEALYYGTYVPFVIMGIAIHAQTCLKMRNKQNKDKPSSPSRDL